LRAPSRIDADNLDTGTCSLVVEHCGQLSPRGIGDGLGQHPTGQARHVQIFDRDPAEAVHQIAGNLMQAIAALVGNASVKASQRGSPLRFCAISRVNALLQAAIVEAAKVRKHIGNRGGLRFVWLNPIFVGENRHAT
jgi:hypothetical protein